MKKFFSPLMAILSIVSPICIVGIMCMIETEIIEAVISGLVLGCMVGSVFSIIFWVTNKYKNKILRIISLIPLVFVGLYSLLFILYLAYKSISANFQFVCMINLNSILATYLEWGQKVPPLSLFVGEKRHRDSKMVPFCTPVF